MEVLKTQREQATEIDKRKILLEKKASVRFRKIFNNMSEDISSLLLNTAEINTEEIAKNYRPDFVGALRQTYRETIKAFGFSLREDVKKKYNINFETELEKKKLNTVVSIKQDFETTESQEQEINKLFLVGAALFINNQSEKQAEKITQTNQKEIKRNIDKSVGDFNLILATNLTEQQAKEEKIRNLTVLIFIGDKTAEKEKIKLEKELIKLKERESKLRDNRNKVVAKSFKDNFKERGKTRSDIISEFEVGQTESFIRQEEASSLDKVVFAGTVLAMKKKWLSVRDSKVRDAHRTADATYSNNPIPISEAFLVGGEFLRYPRDPNGSSKNILRCRCVVIYTLQ